MFSYIWKTNNIIIIHNPLGFKIPMESTLFNNKVVIAVGRISYQKGYESLIDIWGLVYKTHPDWKLHIYGEGDKKKLLGIMTDGDVRRVLLSGFTTDVQVEEVMQRNFISAHKDTSVEEIHQLLMDYHYHHILSFLLINS